MASKPKQKVVDLIKVETPPKDPTVELIAGLAKLIISNDDSSTLSDFINWVTGVLMKDKAVGKAATLEIVNLLNNGLADQYLSDLLDYGNGLARDLPMLSSEKANLASRMIDSYAEAADGLRDSIVDLLASLIPESIEALMAATITNDTKAEILKGMFDNK